MKSGRSAILSALTLAFLGNTPSYAVFSGDSGGIPAALAVTEISTPASSDPGAASTATVTHVRPSDPLLRAEPLLGLQVSGTVTGYRSVGISGTTPGNPIRAQVMWQPFQLVGVLGLGLTGEYYFTKSGLDRAYSGGVQATYQAVISPRQLLVPVGSYSLEWMNIRRTRAESTTIAGHGTSLGLWFALHAIDRSSARMLLQNYGIARTYLTLERRTLSGQEGAEILSGSAYHLGLRIEI